MTRHSHTRSSRRIRLLIIAVDSVLILASITIAYLLRGRLTFLTEPVETLTPIFPHVRLLGAAVWIATIAAFRGYSTREFGSGTETYKRVLNASLTVIALWASILFLGRVSLSRAFFLLVFLIGIPLVLLGRLAVRRVIQAYHRKGRGGQRVLIVGSEAEAQELVTLLERSTWLGLRPVAVVGPSGEPGRSGDTQLPVPAERGLFQLADDEGIDLILFTASSVPSSTDFRRYVWQFEGHHTQLAVVPSLVDIAADRIRTRPVAGLPIVYVEDPRAAGALSTGKRIFDVVTASLALVLLSPILLVTALLVHRDGGPILFTQERVGRDGRPFTMLKFRSMVVDAEKRLASLQGGNATNTVMFKLEKDPRITPVGGFIRRFSIDELPQLINVIRGDMSLIGPRPPLPREVAQYTDDERRRLRVRPGLTGLWQVSGRSDLSWDETIRLDLYYIDNWSVIQDMSILVHTVSAVFSSRGAY